MHKKIDLVSLKNWRLIIMQKKKTKVEKMVENFLKDRKRGLSISAIAKKYEISSTTIYNNKELIARTHGVNVEELFPNKRTKTARADENFSTEITAESVETQISEENETSEDILESNLKAFDEKAEVAKKALKDMIESIRKTRKYLEEN